MASPSHTHTHTKHGVSVAGNDTALMPHHTNKHTRAEHEHKIIHSLLYAFPFLRLLRCLVVVCSPSSSSLNFARVSFPFVRSHAVMHHRRQPCAFNI